MLCKFPQLPRELSMVGYFLITSRLNGSIIFEKITLQCCFPSKQNLLKVNYSSTRKRCIGSKLTIKTPKRRHRRRSGVFLINFEHISHLSVNIVDFERVNALPLFHEIFKTATLNQLCSGQPKLFFRISFSEKSKDIKKGTSTAVNKNHLQHEQFYGTF